MIGYDNDLASVASRRRVVRIFTPSSLYASRKKGYDFAAKFARHVSVQHCKRAVPSKPPAHGQSNMATPDSGGDFRYEHPSANHHQHEGYTGLMGGSRCNAKSNGRQGTKVQQMGFYEHCTPKGRRTYGLAEYRIQYLEFILNTCSILNVTEEALKKIS